MMEEGWQWTGDNWRVCAIADSENAAYGVSAVLINGAALLSTADRPAQPYHLDGGLISMRLHARVHLSPPFAVVLCLSRPNRARECRSSKMREAIINQIIMEWPRMEKKLTALFLNMRGFFSLGCLVSKSGECDRFSKID